MPEAKSTKGNRIPRLTPKQKKLIALAPRVESGELTMQDAMQQAGYSEQTSKQQSSVLGGLRNNIEMQAALRKAGFTAEYLAEGIVKGTTAKGFGPDRTSPDYRTRALYFKLGADLLDVFPSQKHQHELVHPMTYNDLEETPKAKTPEEARTLALGPLEGHVE